MEGRRPPVPFGDELFQLRLQVSQRRKVDKPPARALKDREPLLRLVQPRAVHRCEVQHKAWMGRQPSADCLAVRRSGIIADEMNRHDRGRNLGVQMLQEGAELTLPLAHIALAIHLSCAGVQPGKEIQRPSAPVRMLYPFGRPG
jgi:hypothetical protein